MSRKIEIDKLTGKRGSGYPSPFDEPCLERFRRALGDAAGLTQFRREFARVAGGRVVESAALAISRIDPLAQ